MFAVQRATARIGGLFVAVAIVAGCGSPAASTPAGGAASPGAGTSVATTSQPPVAASADPTAAASVAVPSLGSDTPLVDVLPTELGGAATQKAALVASDLSALDAASAIIFEGVLRLLNASGADMTIGVASNARASVIAIRVTGATGQTISDAMVNARVLNATTTKVELDLGGKHVVKVTTTTSPLPFYVYAAGDVSFTVAAADETIAAEAFSKLP